MSRKPKRARTPTEIAASLEKARLKEAQRRASERASAKNPETWGADAAALKAQNDVEVIMEGKGKVQTARRDDVFDRLLARGGLSQTAHQAIRRLDADMTERRGEGERGSGQKVDGSGSRDLVSQRMIDAGDRVEHALGLVGRRDAALLRELLEPRQVMISVDHERWRQVVVIMTGEAHHHAQGAVVRAACENLAAGYREVDHQPRRAA